MEKKLQIQYIDSLLNGDHNLTKEQREFLEFIKKKTSRAKTYGDLQEIGVELLRFLGLLYGAS